jgi:hypothetical protein
MDKDAIFHLIVGIVICMCLFTSLVVTWSAKIMYKSALEKILKEPQNAKIIAETVLGLPEEKK